MGRKRKRQRPKAGPEDGTGQEGGAGREEGAGTEDGAGTEAEASREALNWVLRRLNVLEYLILLLAVVLALLGGALVAWVLSSSLGFSFRWSWAIGSLLLFILPGGFVYLREFRQRGPAPDRVSKSEPKEPHG